MNFPNKKYSIIYADPPWAWQNFNEGISSRDPEINLELLVLKLARIFQTKTQKN